MNCLGIPIRYDNTLRVLSDSRGIWPFKRVVFGPAIRAFTRDETEAILMHEVGHCKLFHLEKRLLRLWMIFRPKALAEYCKKQEHQADYFVCELGRGRELVSAFQKIQSSGGPLHPDTASRIERILAWHSRA
jgi:Zn-dependent protease with chaperone function